MSADSSRKLTPTFRRVVACATHVIVGSKAQAARKLTASGAASSNLYGIGGGGNSGNLKVFNTGWKESTRQCWSFSSVLDYYYLTFRLYSSSPLPKRNASISSLAGVSVGDDMQGDPNLLAAKSPPNVAATVAYRPNSCVRRISTRFQQSN